MSSEAAFNDLFCIDTLLACNGIIPSLSDFQLNVIAHIEQFKRALLAEQQDIAEVDELCQVLCRYLDARISKSINGHLISWEKYSLAYYFYGYDEKRLSIEAQLRKLLENSNGSVFTYAFSLLHFLPELIGMNDEMANLLTDYSSFTPLPTYINAQCTVIEPDQAPAQPYRNIFFYNIFYSDKSFALQIIILIMQLCALWIFYIHYLDDIL